MKSKKYIIYLLVTILTLSIGLTYAYFKGRVTGEGKDISLKSKGIYVLYSGDATLASESISPGWSITKEFTIENQGSDNETYDIYIEDLINTFVTTGYLQYKITSTNGGYNMSEYIDIPKSETKTETLLANYISIKPKEKHNYTISFIYKDSEEDQSADMGKTLSGTLMIKAGTRYDLQGTQVALDNVLQSQIPSFNNYNNKLEATVKCKSGNAKFNYKKWVLESELGSNCSLTFKDKSINKTYLNDYIMNLAGTTQGDGEVVHEEMDYTASNGVVDYRLSQSQYGNVSQYYSTGSSSTTVTNAFSYSNNVWTSNPSNLTSGTYYHIKFTVPENGYYQLCYTLSSGSTRNYLFIYNGTKDIGSFTASPSSSKSGCIDIRKITTSDSLSLEQRAYDSIATVTFYLNKMNTSTTHYDTGYRYEGSNPNNYILFNDELWRIIGVFDQTTHGVNSSLIKIIKNDSKGILVYNTENSVNSWGESTLYKLLNQETGGSYYTGMDYTNKSSGTYCSGWSEKTPQDCSFSKKGIRSDYARNMIEKTKWYSTVFENDIIGTASDTYVKDTTNTTSTEGYIGLMYASDYGYAVKSSDCARTILLDSYSGSTNGLTCVGRNWLYNGKRNWTLSRHFTSNSLLVNYKGDVGGNVIYWGMQVRPTLYLKSNVYYIGGSGTYDDPIIIGQ